MPEKSDTQLDEDKPSDRDILVQDILNLKGNKIHSINPDDLLSQAVSLMVENDIGSLMVVSGEDPIGQVTFHEILSALHENNGDIKKVTVRGVMTKNVTYGNPNQSMRYVKSLMIDKEIRYLPIIDGDKLVGIMSFRDIARAALNLASHENSMLKKYIKNWPEND